MMVSQMGTSILAEVNVVALIFIGFFLFVWGTIAIMSIKAAAKQSAATRVTPPPLPPLSRIPAQGMPLPPLSTIGRTVPQQRVAAKGRGVRSRKPKSQPPPFPATPQSAAIGSIVGGVASANRASVSSPAEVRSAVSSWVNVKTLRSEFLLAEALRPPVALRKDPFAPQ